MTTMSVLGILTTTMETSNATPTPVPVPSPIRRSEVENKINPLLIIGLLGSGLVMAVVVYFAWGWDPAQSDFSKSLTPTSEFADIPAVVLAHAQSLTATPLVVTVTVPSDVTPVTVIQEVMVIVTATPSPTPEPTVTPYYVYVNNEIEVTREVYIESIPTVTPVPAGYINVCIYGHSLTAIYVNDLGVPGNSCTLLSVLSTINDISILVQR